VWGNAPHFAFRAKERRRWEQIFRHRPTTPVIVEGAGHFVQSDAPGGVRGGDPWLVVGTGRAANISGSAGRRAAKRQGNA